MNFKIDNSETPKFKTWGKTLLRKNRVFQKNLKIEGKVGSYFSIGNSLSQVGQIVFFESPPSFLLNISTTDISSSSLSLTSQFPWLSLASLIISLSWSFVSL